MNENQINHMAYRFLSWRLPDNFRPDGGISFQKTVNEGTPQAYTYAPSGTNLFDAAQAMEMVRYMVEGLPPGLDHAKAPQDALALEAGKVQADQWDETIRGKKMSDAAGRVIFKYQMPVLERFTMKLPAGAEILRVEDQGGMFWMWALVRTDVPDEERQFCAFKTGGKIPDHLSLRYVGFCAVFVQMELGLYIFEDLTT